MNIRGKSMAKSFRRISLRELFHFLTNKVRRYKLQRTLKLKKRGIYEDL